jgi:O-antigen ligase
MGSKSVGIKSSETIPTRWLFTSLAVITLYFQINAADPFNSPKLWLSIIFATWLLGYIVCFRKTIFLSKTISKLFYILFAFAFFLTLATVFSDFRYTSVFGEVQRRNGLLSYLSMAVLLGSAAIFVRFLNIKKLYIVTYFVSSVTTIYAIMQTTGNDFIKWNNPYNSIIGTLGNPNFAAALMAITGVIVFSSLFITVFNLYWRIVGSFLSILLLFSIYKSNAKQGILAYIIGTGFFLIIWIWTKNKKLGVIASLTGLSALVFGILGMLQVGPLEKFLYKPSVTIRGYYWNAGIEMFKANPFFGVGLDRYGAYFKEYREISYPLTYGFQITSTNAHNTFIQFFATGGLFLGVIYLILNGYILKRAILALKMTSGNNRMLIAGVFSAWIAYHAQSLISIDNIGISVWGWVLGGSIVGLSVSATTPPDEEKRSFQVKQNTINLERFLISGISTFVAGILIIFLARGELNAYKSTYSFDLQNAEIKSIYKELNIKAINTPLIDPYYSINAAMNLVQAGFVNEVLVTLEKISRDDPRNLDALNSLAGIYEQTDEISKAVVYREKITQLDPWNADNFLALGKNYKLLGDSVKSKIMLDKILSFASSNKISDQAKIDLAP